MLCPFRPITLGTLLLATQFSTTTSHAQTTERHMVPERVYSRPVEINRSLIDTAPPPLIIINGKESAIQRISQINPSGIEKMDVLKGEAATKQYGDKGRNGVVLVTLKAALKDTIPAYFQGGLIGWRTYLERALHYPEAAFLNNTQGVVSVYTVVDEQGKIVKAQALNNPGNGLAEEAERVIKTGPDWVAATVNGKPATFSFKQKITFMMDGAGGTAPVGSTTYNNYRFNQRVVIKTPRLYKGQQVDGITVDYDRPSLNVQTKQGRSFYINSAEALQTFGIVISEEGFVVPEDASVVYYDNNAKLFDNWEGLKFVGGSQTYSLTKVIGTSKQTPDPAKAPIICLNGKEATVDELKEIYRKGTLRGIGLVKMQDSLAFKKYGQRGKNGVLFISTKMGYPDNFLYMYEGKEIAQDDVPRSSIGHNLSWRVLYGDAAKREYGEKAKYGAVIIKNMEPDSSLPSMVFTKTTQPASFPGGEAGLKKYLLDSLRYPAAARKNKTEATVQVSVLLDSTGTIIRANAMNQPGDGLMQEATRLLREGPAWIPARQNGRAVAYRVLVPVVFKLDPVSYF